MIALKELVANGVQFGHRSWRWSPKMDPFIWGEKNGVHLIDVAKTAQQLERAASFLKEQVGQGEQILLCGTKQSARAAIQEAGESLGMPYVVNRWIGGTLTNFEQVKKSVTKLMHLEDVLSKTEQYNYTKKEFGIFQKTVERLEESVGGIRNMTWPIGALVVIDAKKEAVAVKEAISVGIPVVALVDTNTDPTGIDYIIPGNDDAARSVRTILDRLVTAMSEGKKAYSEQQKRAEKEKEDAAAASKKASSKQQAEAQKAESTTDEAGKAPEHSAEAGDSAAEESAGTEAASPEAKESDEATKDTAAKREAGKAEKARTASASTKSASRATTTTKKASTSTASKSTKQSSSASTSQGTQKQTARSSRARSGASAKQTSQSASSSTKSSQARKAASTKKSSASESDQKASEEKSSEESS